MQLLPRDISPKRCGSTPERRHRSGTLFFCRVTNSATTHRLVQYFGNTGGLGEIVSFFSSKMRRPLPVHQICLVGLNPFPTMMNHFGFTTRSHRSKTKRGHDLTWSCNEQDTSTMDTLTIALLLWLCTAASPWNSTSISPQFPTFFFQSQ